MKRRSLLTIAATLSATAVGLVSSGAAQADSSCASGYVCVWSDTNFSQGKRVFGAGDAGRTIWFDNTKLSTKNRFTNRAVAYVGSGIWAGRQVCVNPGWNAAFPYFSADAMYIGGQGSRC